MRIAVIRPLALLAFAAVALHAQDADMTLRTSVAYRTQSASVTLDPEKRTEVDRLAQLAAQASRAGKYGEAMRDYYHGIAIMAGAEWTPSLELAASLEAHVDHGIVPPGQSVTVSLRALYPLERALEQPVTTSVSLRPARRGASPDKPLLEAQPLVPPKLPLELHITLPEVAPGDYVIETHLLSAAAPTGPGRTSFLKSSSVHIEALSADAAALRARLAKSKSANLSALATAEYAMAVYDAADLGDPTPPRFDFHREFARANEILTALEGGHDPFAGQHGDFRRAYRSTIDKQLQPYRLFIPDQYDAGKPAPLVIALHGMGGDENSMFDSYADSVKTAAARNGFLVAAPKGRKPASMYRGDAEKDVLDVLAEVERDYNVDRTRVYLMGHSMGGYGTWSTAIDHPELFAALGPISGGGDVNAVVKVKDLPMYVVHGDDDKTVSVYESRKMVEAAQKAGAAVKYVEIPGGSHVSVAAPQIGPMFDFFATQRRK